MFSMCSRSNFACTHSLLRMHACMRACCGASCAFDTVCNLPPAEPILQLAINILGVGSIMVSLMDGDREFVVKSAAGFVPPQTMVAPPGICHWNLVPQVHQMVVIEDTLLDARCVSCGGASTSAGISTYLFR